MLTLDRLEEVHLNMLGRVVFHCVCHDEACCGTVTEQFTHRVSSYSGDTRVDGLLGNECNSKNIAGGGECTAEPRSSACTNATVAGAKPSDDSIVRVLSRSTVVHDPILTQHHC